MYGSLIQQQAHHDSKQVIQRQAKWSSQDDMPIPSCFKKLMDSVAGQEKGEIESLQFFYEDIEYVLMESKYPMVGMCKNKVGLRKQLILDPCEPEDPIVVTATPINQPGPNCAGSEPRLALTSNECITKYFVALRVVSNFAHITHHDSNVMQE